MRTVQALAPRFAFKNSGGRGGKLPQPGNHAGFQKLGQWGQSGGRAGTNWGHSYIVRFLLTQCCWVWPFPASSKPTLQLLRTVWHCAGSQRKGAFPWHQFLARQLWITF